MRKIIVGIAAFAASTTYMTAAFAQQYPAGRVGDPAAQIPSSATEPKVDPRFVVNCPQIPNAMLSVQVDNLSRATRAAIAKLTADIVELRSKIKKIEDSANPK